MYEVVYLGYSEKMLEVLFSDSTFYLRLVVGTRGRLSDRYYELIKQYPVQYREMERKKELSDIFKDVKSTDLILMYKFEFIIPNEIIKRNVIINFHGGSLYSNRGAHAVVWSVLLQEKKTCLSCYRLSEGIDEGYLIDTYEVDISENDNVGALNKKLGDGIVPMLESVKRYLSGVKKPELVKGGDYRRKIVEQDYTIDLDSDSINTIRAKILSQQTYNGAIINIDRAEYRVKDFEILENDLIEYRRIERGHMSACIYEGNKKIQMYFKDSR